MNDTSERMIDELGRIVLPIEIRNELGIQPRTKLKISVSDGKILLQKANLTCKLCGADMAQDHPYHICAKCIDGIQRTL